MGRWEGVRAGRVNKPIKFFVIQKITRKPALGGVSAWSNVLVGVVIDSIIDRAIATVIIFIIIIIFIFIIILILLWFVIFFLTILPHQKHRV